MLLIMGNLVLSQVGIATTNPHSSSDLELGATNRALYLNRVADPENDIADPQPGMMLYDTTEHCVKVYGGDPAKWSDCLGGVIEPPTNPPGTGSLSGRMCFDVVEQFVSNACGTIAGRLPQKADFSQTVTNTQTYTFTPIGTVSNVRFVYVNTNGQVIKSITPDADYSGSLTSPQTAKATVVYYNNLNTTAAGLSREQALTADIYVIYNDSANNTGTDKQLKLTAKVQDCNCCGAMVTATQWKEFLCHNLGADISLDPYTPVMGLQGAYIQWGKRGPNTTGDSRIDWQTAPNDGSNGFAAASTAANVNSDPIAGWSTVYAPVNAWNSGTEATPVKTVNDPCPAGYRVPTRTEWTGVNTHNTRFRVGTWATDPWTYTNYGAALNYGPNTTTKWLTLPAAGLRYGGTGNPPSTLGRLGYVGSYGYYWSSTATTTLNVESRQTAYALNFSQTTQDPAYYNYISRIYGHSVRCIAQ